jgi:transcriptional regulator of heat shock response
MNERQSKLLVAIIDQFIQTAEPVGSQELLRRGGFTLSCATIRNEMRALGEEGFLEQPHVSAGRVPTAKGYRFYVAENVQPAAHERAVRQRFDELKTSYEQRKDQERAYDAVALLSHLVPHVAFATVPHKPRVFFLGLANTLRQPEFQLNPALASGVVEVLEQRLADVLAQAPASDKVQYYIGEEHLLPQIQSCSLLIKDYRLRGERGTVGVLGPMRMDYAYNAAALEMASEFLSTP